MSRATILKLSVSVLCLIALFLLYIFGGRVITDDSLPYVENTADIKDVFTFEPDTLVYDGTGDLDFLEGVSLEGYSKEQLKKMIYIRISTGDSLSEKIIEYSADTDDGRVRSMRNLLLRNYNGPDIELPDEMPTVTLGTLDHLKDLMPDDKTYKVDDGFGNDMRAHVQIDAEQSAMNSALVNYTFILENAFGDRAVARTDVMLSDVPATIVLSTASVTIRSGEYIDPYNYIQSATASDGDSIIEEVLCDDLDTQAIRPGEYFINYELRGQTASLRVIVTE